MGDEEHGVLLVLVDLAQQLYDLVLYGHVQGRGGLVRHDQLRLQNHRHGDHHPLAHAAGELVGIACVHLLRLLKSHRPERLQHLFPPLSGGHLRVEPQGLLHLPPCPLSGIQGSHRLLEHHGHAGPLVAAVEGLVPGPARLLQRHAVKKNASCRHTGRIRRKPHEGQGREGFPGAGFPHHAQNLSPRKLQIHMPYHFRIPESHGQILYPDQTKAPPFRLLRSRLLTGCGTQRTQSGQNPLHACVPPSAILRFACTY